MITRIAGAVAAMTLAASCASQSGTPEARSADAQSSDSKSAGASGSKRECFFLSEVNGFNYAGRDRIHVSTGPNETFEFKTLGPCPELGDSEGLGFDPVGPATICSGIDIDLIVPTTIGPRRCAVSMIRKLPPKERPAR